MRSALILANKEFKRLDNWREKQTGNFVEILILSAHDLECAQAEKRISTLAWITRNLLELSTWIDYCNISRENAKTFHDDSMRDMYGWASAIHSLYMVQKNKKHAPLEEKIDNLKRLAQEKGFGELADDFTRVQEAAGEVGYAQEFTKLNKLYSKFAHPTAWVVHSFLAVDADEGLRDMFFKDGVGLAVGSLRDIRANICSVFPEVETMTEVSSLVKQSPLAS